MWVIRPDYARPINFERHFMIRTMRIAIVTALVAAGLSIGVGTAFAGGDQSPCANRGEAISRQAQGLPSLANEDAAIVIANTTPGAEECRGPDNAADQAGDDTP
jgi:hypothetical protein